MNADSVAAISSYCLYPVGLSSFDIQSSSETDNSIEAGPLPKSGSDAVFGVYSRAAVSDGSNDNHRGIASPSAGIPAESGCGCGCGVRG